MKKIAIAFVMVFGIGMISNAAMALNNPTKTELSKERGKKKKKAKKGETTCTQNGEKKSCCSKSVEK